VGNLLGRAQRYVADVKGEVSRQIELEELKKMKDGMQSAATDLQKTVEDSARAAESSFEQNWNEATAGINSATDHATAQANAADEVYYASHFRPKKTAWRKRQAAIPQWYKRQNGIRTRTQSGAARVAKHRPKL
jgi:sec-independent protein translocase protein TatB